MASAYPGGLDTFATNKANATATTTDHPAHHNDLADAVNKIEAELGITPSGAEATVAARLTTIEAAGGGHLMLEDSLLAAAGANDVLWDGNDLAAFTAVATTGTNNITEQDDMLSAKWWNMTGDDINGILKAFSFTVGDAWTVPVWMQNATGDHGMAGILFSDGTAAGSNSLLACLRQVGASHQRQLEFRRGTMTNSGTSTVISIHPAENRVWLKLTYVSANTFRLEASPDGIQYSAYQADCSFTLTPTQIGLGWMYGNASQASGSIAAFGPFRKVA